jgi:ArsR family transcriptional regulator
MKKTKTQLQLEKMQVSAEILRALAHPLRMKILEFIDKNESINVNKIYNTMKLEQSITSQHLKILRSSGLVHTYREGKFIHYTTNYAKAYRSIVAVENLLSPAEDWKDPTDYPAQTPEKQALGMVRVIKTVFTPKVKKDLVSQLLTYRQ